MKKRVKWIALLLCIVTVAGLLSGVSFAADDSKPYDKYIALGDSIAGGYALDVYFDYAASIHNGDRYYISDGTIIKGSYVDLISTEVVNGYSNNSVTNATELYARCGWRTTELLRALGISAPGNSLDVYDRYYTDHNFYLTSLSCVGYGSVSGLLDQSGTPGAIRKALTGLSNQKVNLVTVNYGMNDIFSYALGSVYFKYDYILGSSGITDVSGLDGLLTAFAKLLQSASQNQLRGILTEFSKATKVGLSMYKKNMPTVLSTLKGLIGNADLAVIGVTDPIDFSRDLALKLGLEKGLNLDGLLLTDRLVNEANTYTEALCEETGCVFVDVSDAPYFGFGSFDLGEFLTFGNATIAIPLRIVHPDEAGHQFIAEHTLDSLYYFHFSEHIITGLNASFTSFPHKVKLTWDRVDGASGYEIYRSGTEDGVFTRIGTVKKNSFTDMALFLRDQCYYKVVAVMDDTGFSFSPSSDIISCLLK